MADKAPTAPEAPANDPNFADDSAEWAALAKEIEGTEDLSPSTVDDELEAVEAKAPAEPKSSPEPEKPKPSYDQLESNYKNAQGAFKAERDARKRAEDQIANYNKAIEELREQRRQRVEQANPQPEAPKIPDVNEDPIGHFSARLAERDKVIEQLLHQNQQTSQQSQAQQQEQIFWNHVSHAEAEFRKTSPKVTVNGQETSDYDAACEHLKQHRMSELAYLYPDESPIAAREAQQYGFPSPGHLRMAILQQDAVAIAHRAFQLGVSPAQMYYEAAKGRGYATPQAAPAVSKAAAKTSPQIESARRGQKASLTISGGEGRKSSNDMSIADLTDLYKEDPVEADKIFDRMAKAGLLG